MTTTLVPPATPAERAAPTARATSAPPTDRRRAGSPPLLPVATGIGLLVALVSSWWQLTLRPLWIDEAISLGATHQLAETIDGTAGTMAAYYVLLDGWTAIFGTTRADLRSLSVVLCLLAVALVAVLARRVLRPAEAAAAVLITATLPGLVRMAQDARSYALCLVLATTGWILLCRLVATQTGTGGQSGGGRGWAWALALVPVAATGVLAHGLFVLQLAPMALSVLVHPRRRALVLRLLPMATAGGVTLGVLWSMGARNVADWIPPLSWSRVRPFVATVVGNEMWVMLVLGAVMIGGAVALARRAAVPEERWAALLPLWWGLAPPVLLLALSTVRPIFLGRYALPSLPGVGMLVAVGAARGGAWVAARGDALVGTTARARRAVRVVVGMGVVVILVAAVGSGRVARSRFTYEEWDRVARLVAAEARPGDGLIFTHAGANQAIKDTARAPFEAAWREVDPRAVPVALSPDRPLGEVRRFDDLTPPAELSRRMVAHRRIWIVQFPGFDISLRAVLALAPAAGAFRRVRTETFGGGAQVVLLERV